MEKKEEEEDKTVFSGLEPVYLDSKADEKSENIDILDEAEKGEYKLDSPLVNDKQLRFSENIKQEEDDLDNKRSRARSAPVSVEQLLNHDIDNILDQDDDDYIDSRRTVPVTPSRANRDEHNMHRSNEEYCQQQDYMEAMSKIMGKRNTYDYSSDEGSGDERKYYNTLVHPLLFCEVSH